MFGMAKLLHLPFLLRPHLLSLEAPNSSETKGKSTFPFFLLSFPGCESRMGIFDQHRPVKHLVRRMLAKLNNLLL